MLALDLSSIIPFAITAIAVFFGFLYLLKKAAVKYFVVDETFDRNYNCCQQMSIGGKDYCAVCRKSGSKICSRCKSVRYCSEACQSKHWNAGHKSKCKPANSSNKTNSDAVQRKKTFGSISLVPSRGSYKRLQEPKKILFSYDEFLKLFDWKHPGFPPCGLLNCGNSCFANVVLQCLASTRPLTAYLLEKDHSRTCTRKLEDWCFLCELQTHIQRVGQSSQPFSPTNILSRIPNIGGNLGYGSQEDAHEFMRFAIDTMQSICLDEHGGEKYLDPSTQETTVIQHIFGGHLRSQVKCTKCNTVSNRYENMMDLTVEIHGDASDARSLEECLNQFTVSECLDGDNKYKCDGCNDYVKAWKRLTVHQAPNILTITLKRFQTGRFGKLNKRITFPEELDLSPYMSDDGDGTDLYSLYAVVVHVDMLNASYFGHYICYTKHCGRWYMIDDGNVKVVDVDEVLSEGAYMLLYSRRTARKKPFATPKETMKKNIEENAIVSNDSNGDMATVSSEVQVSSIIPNVSTDSSEARVTADITSIPFSSNSNGDLVTLPSTSNPELDVSSLTDTGHDRVAADCAEQVNSDLKPPVDADISVAHKNVNTIELELEKPGSSDSKNVNFEDYVVISGTCTESNASLACDASRDTFIGPELIQSGPVQGNEMVFNAKGDTSAGINDQGDAAMVDTQITELDQNGSEAAILDFGEDFVSMECDEPFSVSDSNHNMVNGEPTIASQSNGHGIKSELVILESANGYDARKQNYPENGSIKKGSAVLNYDGHVNGKPELNGYITDIEALKSQSLDNIVLLPDSEVTDANNSCKVNGHSDLEKETNLRLNGKGVGNDLVSSE